MCILAGSAVATQGFRTLESCRVDKIGDLEASVAMGTDMCGKMVLRIGDAILELESSLFCSSPSALSCYQPYYTFFY